MQYTPHHLKLLPVQLQNTIIPHVYYDQQMLNFYSYSQMAITGIALKMETTQVETCVCPLPCHC